MFKESFEQGGGENQTEKTELEKKLDQLTLMRRKKASLEGQLATPVSISEAERIEKEYAEVSELVTLIENDVNTLKASENERLEAKFEHAEDASNDNAFDNALRATGEAQAADRLEKRKAA